PGPVLDPASSAALGGLLLSTAVSRDDPFIAKMLQGLSSQITGLDSFKTSELQSVALEGSFSPAAGLTGGFSFSKAKQEVGQVDYGFEFGGGLSEKTSYTLSVDDRPKDKTYVPSFELKSSFNFNGALGVGLGERNEEQKIA